MVTASGPRRTTMNFELEVGKALHHVGQQRDGLVQSLIVKGPEVAFQVDLCGRVRSECHIKLCRNSLFLTLVRLI